MRNYIPPFQLTKVAEAVKLSIHARRTGFDDRAYYTKLEAIQKATLQEQEQ